MMFPRVFILGLTLLVAVSLLAAEEMQTRVYHIPPDFLLREYDPPPDPFAVQPPARRPDHSQEVLEGMGLTFPLGAKSRFGTTTNLLTIHNTLPNLELFEKYSEEQAKTGPKSVRWEFVIIEDSGDSIKPDADAANQLKTMRVLATQPDSGVTVLEDAILEGKSGYRITQMAGTEYAVAESPLMHKEGGFTVSLDHRPIGMRVEMEATMSNDSRIIEATLAIHSPTPVPVTRQVKVGDPSTGNAVVYPATDLQAAEWVTGASFKPGETKVVGVMTSPWNKEKHIAAFLTPTLVESDPNRVQTIFEGPQAGTKVPDDMTAVTLNLPPTMYTTALPDRMQDSLLTWLETASLQAPGSSFRLDGGRLHLVNTHENIERIALAAHHLNAQTLKNIRVTCHTIQAPGELCRDAAIQDSDTLFHRLEDAVAAEKARYIDSAVCLTTPNAKGSHSTIDEHRWISEFSTDGARALWPTLETRPVGSILEFEGSVGLDNHHIEASIGHELHAGPPRSRRAEFIYPDGEKPVDLPLMDFDVYKTNTGITLENGTYHLLSIHKPPGSQNADDLWITFIRADVVLQHMPPRPLQPEPVRKVPPPPADPNELEVRFYRVPPDFLQSSNEEKVTAKQVLESVGIQFPKGSSATFVPTTSQIIVRNTRENLDLVDILVADCTYGRSTPDVAITSHIVEAPGALLRQIATQAATSSNHEALLNKLLTHKETKRLDHSHIKGKAGTRGGLTQGPEVSYLADFVRGDRGEPVIDQQTRQTGLQLDVEPTIHSDGTTVGLNLRSEFHTSPPTVIKEQITHTGGHFDLPLTVFHHHTSQTGFVIADGATQLVSMWKKAGTDEDILQAQFITVRLLRSQ